MGHAEHVLSSVRQGLGLTNPGLFGAIVRSWSRCLNSYGLNPSDTFGSGVADGSHLDLGERKEHCEQLLSSARGEMSSLYRQLLDRDTLVVIADATGTVLETLGDGAFARRAAHLGMQPGSDWSERVCGTNGIGTCLAERRPMLVNRTEHFFSSLTGLSCAAVPIFDETDELVGVLDVTSASDLSARHFRMLIGISVHAIENLLFETRFSHAHILHLHSRRELVQTFHEGLIAFDEDGTVLATNQSAVFQIGCRRHDELVGRSVSEVLGTEARQLLSGTQDSHCQPMPLRTSGGRSFFALTRPAGKSSQRRRRSQSDEIYGSTMRQWGDASIDQEFARGRLVFEKGVYILVEGETGCGKEVFARSLHNASSRAQGPFVAVNCAALPETLIESELFGYRGGAFTGAARDGRRGRIAAADKGTLLLDEIGDMPLALQARLLRVLEEKEVTPLGAESPIKVDVRVICATHRNLGEMVAAGTFRSDLYFRIAGFNIRLLPLRERSGRHQLIRAMLADFAPRLELDEDALACLAAYPWPGNLRQLRNVLETVAALVRGQVITQIDLPTEIRANTAAISACPVQATVTTSCDTVATRETEGRGSGDSYLERAEREALKELLSRNRWNVTLVASELGVSRNTVYRKVNRYKLMRQPLTK